MDLVRLFKMPERSQTMHSVGDWEMRQPVRCGEFAICSTNFNGQPKESKGDSSFLQLDAVEDLGGKRIFREQPVEDLVEAKHNYRKPDI
ncbi:hypothetical protein H6P81_006481 [Aristolochia fimbriata]|uniref:Uncharacterized protein n=1 Tax=Aristolochia fimbriata TaxID=158543 RepID=A0AAV7EXL2_ARIFI|nr:hypothetical protein H6P81_006481 [Aristolochia fimbriata]